MEMVKEIAATICQAEKQEIEIFKRNETERYCFYMSIKRESVKREEINNLIKVRKENQEREKNEKFNKNKQNKHQEKEKENNLLFQMDEVVIFNLGGGLNLSLQVDNVPNGTVGTSTASE